MFGLGFVLSFGYWTTNFAEVQRALSASNMSAARRTPIIARLPEAGHPGVTIIPGLVALVTVKGLGADTGDLHLQQRDPAAHARVCCPTACSASPSPACSPSFMAGMAANVSGFNTVFTYDIWQEYIKKDRDGRATTCGSAGSITVVGVLIGIGTAFIAAGLQQHHELHPGAVLAVQRAAVRRRSSSASSGSG